MEAEIFSSLPDAPEDMVAIGFAVGGFLGGYRGQELVVLDESRLIVTLFSGRDGRWLSSPPKLGVHLPLYLQCQLRGLGTHDEMLSPCDAYDRIERQRKRGYGRIIGDRGSGI